MQKKKDTLWFRKLENTRKLHLKRRFSLCSKILSERQKFTSFIVVIEHVIGVQFSWRLSKQFSVTKVNAEIFGVQTIDLQHREKTFIFATFYSVLSYNLAFCLRDCLARHVVKLTTRCRKPELLDARNVRSVWTQDQGTYLMLLWTFGGQSAESVTTLMYQKAKKTICSLKPTLLTLP